MVPRYISKYGGKFRHVLFTVFNAVEGVYMTYYFGWSIISLFAIAFFSLGITESWEHSVYAESIFTEPLEIYSKGKVLQTTIVAAEQETKLNGQPVSTRVYNGSLVGPKLHVAPGDRIELILVNELDEPTNLHFHGLHISPSGYSDNVFREVGPGQTAKYMIDIPTDHPPGTFWYHLHQHHLSYKQVSDGLSGLDRDRWVSEFATQIVT